MCPKKDILYICLTRKPFNTKTGDEKMRCPYLSEKSKKVCVKMLEMNLNGELTDFDIKHFCDGNPIYCYYFRLPQIQERLKQKRIEAKTGNSKLNKISLEIIRQPLPENNAKDDGKKFKIEL